MLMERKILLIKDNFGDIALIMEALVELLAPLKWNFIFITYLTPKLIECLDAPFPYLIGVSRKVWEDHCVMREINDTGEVIIFDIDRQERLNLQWVDTLPVLPQPQANMLERSLREVLDMKERFTQDVLNSTDFEIQDSSDKMISQDQIDEYYWAYAQLKVKQAFFNFFLFTLNNYIGYFKPLDSGSKNPQLMNSSDMFDFKGYLGQFKGGDEDQYRFMDKLVVTQCFSILIEDTFLLLVSDTMPQNSDVAGDYKQIKFFRINLAVMLTHSFKRLRREQNKMIEETFMRLRNPIRFNMAHIFERYLRNLSLHSGLEQLIVSKFQAALSSGFALDMIDPDLVSEEMPGLQYEQIAQHEYKKTMRQLLRGGSGDFDS
jgi:hypothetical protein